MKIAPVLVLLGLAGCSSAPPPTVAPPLPEPTASSSVGGNPLAPPPPAARSYQADKDLVVTTARGAKVPVASGWYVTEEADRLTLEDPEKKLKVVLFEIESPRGPEAIELAWQRYDAAFVRKPLQSISPPPRKWDEVTQVIYETDPTTRRFVLANARRKGTVSWVVILDGDKAILDRRGAQIQNTFDKLEAPGVVDESFAGKKAAPLEGERAKALAAFIEKARAALKVPGVAVSVVQGGKVVFEQGFGVRELGKKEPVTPTTLFLIGSTTKSLSTLLMAKAVDEGKFAWDTRVKQVYPSFTLGDAALTDKVTMQHLVCACTGIPRHDLELLFNFDKVKPEAFLDSMRTLKPTTGFGETFQYNNQLVAAGGFLAGHVFYPKLPLGEAYDKALREKVLVPLGMTDTTLSFAEARRHGYAMSHGDDANGDMHVLPIEMEHFVTPLRPSGGVWSDVRDMARYLQAEIAHGKSVTGVQVASEANVMLRRKPQVKISDDAGYGLGLIGGTSKGLAFVEHGGATFGQRSTFVVLPEHDIGLTVLANGPGSLGQLIKSRLFELLFDSTPRAEESLAFELDEEKKSIQLFREKLTDAPPADEVKKLLGSYREATLGEIKLTDQKGQLWLDVGEWKSRVGWKKRTDGKKDLVLLDPPVVGLPFELREQGSKPALSLSFLQHDYTFSRP